MRSSKLMHELEELHPSRLTKLHTLGSLDVSLSCVVRHRYADDHIQGKELVVESALSLHIHLHQPTQKVSSGCHERLSADMFQQVFSGAVN